jgi:plastocyanin
MTSRWRISFRPVLAGVLLAQAVFGASVTGQVELTNSQDPAVHKRKDYSGVVLWLEPVDRTVAPPAGVHARMEQKDKHFVPHVVAIPVGGTVDFPNLDPIYHSAFSNFAGQPFDIGLYQPGSTKSQRFGRAGIVRVFCQIHSTMSAVIAVMPTPWYVVTTASGKFAINNVPPGEYQLRLYHERALEDNLRFLEHRITVPETGMALPLISISETGYVPQPHLNKYGKPYAPEGGTYKGGGQ